MKLYRVQDDPLYKSALMFGDDLPKVKVIPERLKDMHRVYGVKDDEICGHCQFYIHNNKYPKCAKSKITNGKGTDWQYHWVACQLFQAKQQP